MLQLKRIIKADIIKLKATQITWIHLYIPIVGLFIFLSYYSYTPWSSFSKISVYLQSLSIVFPILVSIITSMIAEQEYMAGNFQYMLIGSEAKYLAFISKFILSLLLGTFSTLFAIFGFYVGFSLVENNILPLTLYLSIAGILISSNIFLYIFHFFLSFRFSKEVSIGVGIVESLVAALFLTGMGDGRWPFVPSSWSIRFIELLLMKYKNGANILFNQDLILGIILSVIVTSLSFLIMLIWFTKWEGNKLEE